MLLPLISAGIGVAGAIEASTRKDPTARLQAQMEKNARLSEKYAAQNFAGGGAADIRNTAANKASSAMNKSAGSGQGYTPRLAEELGRIAGEEASGVTQLRMADAQRRQQLIQQAGQTRAEISSLKGQFEQQKRQDIFGSLTSGAQGALTLAMPKEENLSFEDFVRLMNQGGTPA